MIKLFFASLSAIVSVLCFIPYIRDIYKGNTKPHAYSWLVWAILQGVGGVIILSEGGKFGALSILIGSALCFLIFFLSFRYGTKNIKVFDKICLVASLISIFIWFFLKTPFYSVILISIIDFVGFLPTLRKSYLEPETETILTYELSVLSALLAILSLSDFSFVTSFYLISLTVTNSSCAIIILLRKKNI